MKTMYQPGDLVETFEHGQWLPAVIRTIASYIGRSGPGYYASYDPPASNCSQFWTCDRYLRPRNRTQGAA